MCSTASIHFGESFIIILIGLFSGETVELSIRNDLNEGGNWKVIDRVDTDSNGKISFNLDKGKVRMTIFWSQLSVFLIT